MRQGFAAFFRVRVFRHFENPFCGFWVFSVKNAAVEVREKTLHFSEITRRVVAAGFADANSFPASGDNLGFHRVEVIHPGQRAVRDKLAMRRQGQAGERGMAAFDGLAHHGQIEDHKADILPRVALPLDCRNEFIEGLNPGVKLAIEAASGHPGEP
jgi:hypothetical protein